MASLQLPKFFVDSHFIEELVVGNEKRFIPKGILASSFDRAWKDGLTGKNIIVAVIDTGIDPNHPDLKGKIIKSINLTGEPINESHGTHVAGTIAANGFLLGGAYDCKLIDIKVIGKKGGTISNVIKGIGFAVINGASIINMSLGASDLSNTDIEALSIAIHDAWNKGCICVSAAGNDGTTVCTPDKYEYPASIEKSESIAACEVSEDLSTISLAKFSTENNRVDVAACGVNVLSSIIGGKYGVFSGTSMATPHVSAMLALFAQDIKNKKPSLGGSTFSNDLVSMVHNNVLKIEGCGPQTFLPKSTSVGNCYRSALSGGVNIKYDNISFGLGFVRYQPELPPLVPEGTKFFNNSVFLGYLTSNFKIATS